MIIMLGARTLAPQIPPLAPLVSKRIVLAGSAVLDAKGPVMQDI